MPAKLATQAFHKIKVFWKKGCDVIISVLDVINNILTHDLYLFVDIVLWPKFDNSRIYIREIIIVSVL